MAHRALLAGAGPTVLTAVQRVRLANLMNPYLTDPIVVEHFLAHGGTAGVGPGVALHSFNSHRELVMALEDHLKIRLDAGDPNFMVGDPFLPFPAFDPSAGLPDDSATPGFVIGFRDVRQPDNAALPSPPWPAATPPPAPAPPCSPNPNTTPTFFPIPIPLPPPNPAGARWPILADFTAGPAVPFTDPCSVAGVNNASDLWTAINTWHLNAHDHIGGSMAETPLSINGVCYRTEPFRQAALIFLPFHAFVDEVYWKYQHCAGHGLSPALAIPGSFGDSSQGGAIEVADTNVSGMWDLVVAHVDHPPGTNLYHYRIGRDLDESGNATSWIGPFTLPDPIGAQTQGAGVAVGNIRNKNRSLPGESALDIVAFWVEVDGAGVKHGRYRVGWNLDPATGQPRGDATHPTAWSAVMTVFDPFTGAGNPDVRGVGIALGRMTTPFMRIVVFRVEQQGAGPNVGRFQVGKIDGITGAITAWTGDHPVGPAASPDIPLGLEDAWFTPAVQGADVTIADTHGDGLLDLIFFYVGSQPGGTNHGYFRIGYHVAADTGAVDIAHGYFDQAGHPTGWSRTWVVPTPGPASYEEMSTRPVDRLLAKPADFNSSVHGAGVAFVGGFTGNTPGTQPSYSLRSWTPGSVATTHPFGGASPTQGDLIFFHLVDPVPPGPSSNRGYYRVGHALDINGEFS